MSSRSALFSCILFLGVFFGCQQQYRPADWRDVSREFDVEDGVRTESKGNNSSLDLDRFGEITPWNESAGLARTAIQSDSPGRANLTTLPARSPNRFSLTTLPSRRGTTLPLSPNGLSRGTTLPRNRAPGNRGLGTTLPMREDNTLRTRSGMTLQGQREAIQPLRGGTTLPDRR